VFIAYKWRILYSFVQHTALSAKMTTKASNSPLQKFMLKIESINFVVDKFNNVINNKKSNTS